MAQAEHAERPRQRKKQIKKAQRIKRERVPLGGERKAAIVQRIPKRHFAAPKGLFVIKRQRITKHLVIPEEESFEAGDHLREAGQDQHAQQGRKPPGREPLSPRVFQERRCAPARLKSCPANFSYWKPNPRKNCAAAAHRCIGFQPVARAALFCLALIRLMFWRVNAGRPIP